jgi:Kef-type K+ transport system membrane component KefB
MRLGQPSVSGKLVAGLLLSPGVIDVMGRLSGSAAAADRSQMATIASLGVVLLLFLAGLETDLDEFVRAGRGAVIVATGGVVTSVGLIFGTAVAMGMGAREALFIGVMLCATSVSISVQTLFELRRVRTPAGLVILGAAVTDDVMGLMLFSFVLAGLGIGGTSPLVLAAGLAAYVILSLGLGLRYSRIAVDRLRGLRSTEGLLGATIAFSLLMGWLAQESGIAAITGAYLAGLIVGRAAGEELSGRVRTVAYALPVPVFLVNVGMQTDLGHLSGGWLLVALPAVAVIAKIVGCGVGAILSGFRGRMAVGIGVGMVPRGEVTLVIAVLGVTRGVVTQTGYTVGVLAVLVSALVTPPILKGLLGVLQAPGAGPSGADANAGVDANAAVPA